MPLSGILKKYWLLILLAIVGYPFLLHTLFKARNIFPFFSAEWAIGDILIYGGAVFQAAATIFAIMETIAFTKENQEKEGNKALVKQREERRLAIRPYLSSEHRRVDRLIEPSDNRLYVIWEADKFPESSDIIPPIYRAVHEKSGLDTEYHIREYILANYGAGNALEVTFMIAVNGNELPVIPPFSLPKDMKRSFVILLSRGLLPNDNSLIPFSFRFSFSDVESIARYEQTETMQFSKNKEGKLCIEQDSKHLLSNPKIIDPTKTE